MVVATRVNVIGAGVVGLCVATELASRGLDVALHDRAVVPGPAACSWWAGGMLAPDCERESAEEPVARLGAEAAAWWQRHTGAVTRNGSLVVAPARDRGELRRFARRTGGHEEIHAATLAALEPDLAGRFEPALWFAQEAHLDPRAAQQRLLEGLRERGVALHIGEPLAASRAGARTVDCRGLAAADVLDDLRGVKGEMLVLRTAEVSLSRPVRLLHPRIPLYIVPRPGGVFMVGATSIESDDRRRISVRSMLELLNAAYTLHPAFGEAEVVEIGVDARPAFADNLPRLRWRGDTLYVNGLYRHGFLLSPALARMAADALLDAKHVPELMDEHPLER